MKIKLGVFFVFLLLFISCNKEDVEKIDTLQEKIKSLERVNDLLVLKNLLLETEIANEAIFSFESVNIDEYSILFESVGSVKVSKSLVKSYEVDSLKWKLKLVFIDESTTEIDFIGSEEAIDINLNLNPLQISPLTASSKISIPLKSNLLITVIGQDGQASNITQEYQDVTSLSVDLFGLYPNFENTIEFSFYSNSGTLRKKLVKKIVTKNLPSSVPEFEVKKAYASPSPNMLFLVNYRPANIPIMVDAFGKVRWYTTGFTAAPKYGLQRLKNGNFIFGRSGNKQGSLYEFTITGKLVSEFSFYPTYENAHHDVYEMTNGNFIVPVNKTDLDTVEDFIIEIKRNSGQVGKIWDLTKILPKRDTLINDPIDWFHVNAVIHDERDNSLIISGQRSALVKVSWENELKWILSSPEDWKGYEDYLLISEDANPEWIWGQHAPCITPTGSIFLFDNGYGRNFGKSDLFSRAVEFKITENLKGGSFKTAWEYGKERGESLFSPILSDVDYLADSQTRLIVNGSIAYDLNYIDKDNISGSWSSDLLKATIIEINDNKEILFELHIKSTVQASSVYRAEKLFF